MIPTRWSRSGSGSMACAAVVAAIAAGAVLATTPVLSSQAVLLRMAPEEGLVSRYRMTMESHMDSPMMPSSDEPFMLMESTSTQTVTAVEGDVRGYTVVMDSASVETPAMPTLAQNMPEMAGQEHTMRMDVRGRIVGWDMNESAPPQAREMMSRMAGRGFGMELPEGPVSPGDTWTGTQEFDISGVSGQSMTMTIDLTYTLDSVDGDVAAFSYTGPMTMGAAGGGGAMQASGQMSGTMRLDVGVGRILGSDMQMSMEMSVQGQSIEIDQTMSMALID